MPCPEANTPWLTARYTPPPTTATSIAPLVFRKLRRFKVIDCRALQGEREESPAPIQGILGLLCNYVGGGTVGITEIGEISVRKRRSRQEIKRLGGNPKPVDCGGVNFVRRVIWRWVHCAVC